MCCQPSSLCGFRALKHVHLLYADIVTKVNKTGKAQQRLVAITNSHLYSCLPQEGDIQRCIELAKVRELRLNRPKNELVLMVPDEYDMMLQARSAASFSALLAALPQTAEVLEINMPIPQQTLRLEKPLKFERFNPWLRSDNLPSLAATRECYNQSRGRRC